MRISDMNWMQVEEYLTHDDRAVIPLGCTEQHAYLSLATDSILAERVSVEAAEPLGVVVFPALAYGITPYFLSFPGSVSLRPSTYLDVVRDMLDSVYGQGFRRLLLVNGHGGNTPAMEAVGEWLTTHGDARAVFHNWWNAPETSKAVRAIDPLGSHASWMENFPWTRIAAAPDAVKPPIDVDLMRTLDARGVRELIGDGNFGGAYEKPDGQMLEVWRAGVEETRKLIDGL